MSQNGIKLNHLSIGYRVRRGQTKTVATDICAEAKAGTLTCLLGRNGTGKSTLIRTIAGFDPLLKGDILIDGKSIAGLKPRDMATKVGVVLTDKPQTGMMTVREIVALGRTPHTGFWGTLSADDQIIIDNALNLLSMSDMSTRKVEQLSDGERQRAMIAKALAQQTPVILLDEPTAFLDYPGKNEIMGLLHNIARTENKAIIIASHDLDIVMRTADRMWLIDKGKLTEGTPETMIEDGRIAHYCNMANDTETFSEGH